MGQNRKAIMVPRRFSWVSKGEGPRRWRSNRRISDGCGGVVKAVRGDEARDTGVGGVRGSDENGLDITRVIFVFIFLVEFGFEYE